MKNERGEIAAAMELCLDITQLKRLEVEVQKSELKYQTIFNNIPNPVFVLYRKNLKILDCNDSVTDTYGFSKEEISMRSFLDLFEGDDGVNIAPQLETKKILTQVRQVTKSGHVIYVNIRISPSEYMGHDVLLVTTSDITKRLMAEQQLIQASKMTTLGEMATGIAHELNQPLSVIKTAGSFLKKKVDRKEPIEDGVLKTMAEEIDSHVDRASQIITHMRDFGRKSDVLKEKVQVKESLNRALRIFSQQLKLREITVEKDFEEDLPLILADANRLEQVFINLLINARDAIEEKGEALGNKDFEKKILLRVKSKNDKVVVEIADTGTGIPESIRDKIFEPFYTTKKVGKGTGLGLSISYGIIQDYEGTIRVNTKNGQGSHFIIEFPVYSRV
jgi:histidine kinase